MTWRYVMIWQHDVMTLSTWFSSLIVYKLARSMKFFCFPGFSSQETQCNIRQLNAWSCTSRSRDLEWEYGTFPISGCRHATLMNFLFPWFFGSGNSMQHCNINQHLIDEPIFKTSAEEGMIDCINGSIWVEKNEWNDLNTNHRNDEVIVNFKNSSFSRMKEEDKELEDKINEIECGRQQRYVFGEFWKWSWGLKLDECCWDYQWIEMFFEKRLNKRLFEWQWKNSFRKRKIDKICDD